MAAEKEDLRILDISNLSFEDSIRVEKLVAQLNEACETSGFFLLKLAAKCREDDFGKICLTLMEEAKKVFALPPNEKEKLVIDETSQNYYKGKPIAGSGAGLRPIGQDPNFVADLRESFNIAVPVLSDEEEEKALSSPLHCGNGRNKWPNPMFVGHQWRTVVGDYTKICMDACKTLARLFALALNLPLDYFEQPGFFDNPTCMLGMNTYNFPNARIWQDETDAYGIKPHMDSGIFTLLLTDGSDGLERCVNRKSVDELTSHNERIWVPVPSPKPEEGLLIVNLGKNMDFWTGGRYKATLHRVVNKTKSQRFSIPFFYEPNIDVVIRPIINTKDPVKNTQMKEYIQKKFGRNYIMPADLYYERLKERKNKNFDP